LAMEKLEQNPLAEGNFYAGDLLVNVLQAGASFWSKSPALASKLERITSCALEVPTITKIESKAIRKAYNCFRDAHTSSN